MKRIILSKGNNKGITQVIEMFVEDYLADYYFKNIKEIFLEQII